MYLAVATRCKSAVICMVHLIDGVQAEVVSVSHKEVEVSARPERVSGPRYSHIRRAYASASAVSLDRVKAISQARNAVGGDMRR